MNSYAILWIVFLIFVLSCHGYLYYTLTGNALEGFREGQTGVGEPIYSKPVPDAPKGSPPPPGSPPPGAPVQRSQAPPAVGKAPPRPGGPRGPPPVNDKNPEVDEKIVCNDNGECRKKYMEAYKATGCVGDVEPAVLDWWREKKEDSNIWKDMMNRCQKSLQPNIEDGGELTKEQLLDAQMKCCGGAGCKPKACALQTEWLYKCEKGGVGGPGGDSPFCPVPPGEIQVPAPAPVVASVEDNTEVPAPEPQPRQTPITPETIPETPKEEDTPPIQIPGHTHGAYDNEQSGLLEDIRNTISKMKEKMNESNKKDNKTKLTPDQYLLWKKAVGAIKVPIKPKNKPQPISVNVDVTDSRELHYQMPAQGDNNIDKLKDILGKMNLSEATKQEIGKELGNVKIEGKKIEKKEDESWSAKQAHKSHSAKFSKLLKNAKQSKYVAYNEDDYGDLKKGQKEKESALEKGL
jgi:hypothetical protein